MGKRREACSDCFTDEKAGAPKRSFCFFKVMIGDFAKRLRIPPAFVKHIENKDSNNVILEGPSKKLWNLTLQRTIQGIFLQKGWQKFVEDHSLQLGEFLVFRYNGDLHFTVQIFDKSACEKDDSLRVENGEGSISCEENQEREEVKQDPTPNKKGRGRPKKRPASLPNQINSNSLTIKKVVVKQENKSGTIIRNSSGLKELFMSSRRPVTEEERARAYKAASSFKSINPHLQLVMRRVHVYMGFFLHIPVRFSTYFPQESRYIILHGPSGRSWKVHHLYKEGKCYLSGGWRSFSLMNNLEEGDVCVLERVSPDFKFNVHIFRVVDNPSGKLRILQSVKTDNCSKDKRSPKITSCKT